MIQTVVKRDGRIVGFNEEKIITAIRKAMLHTEKGEDMSLIRQITDHISFKGDSQMTVEAIQDAVEMELMESSRKDVAQKYIAYRNQRSIAREAKTKDIFLETDVAENMRLRGVIAQLDGAQIIKIPANRLPSDFGFMIAHPVATVAPTKLEDYRVHQDPPGISGDLVEGRICYDAFVLDNKKAAIYYQAVTEG